MEQNLIAKASIDIDAPRDAVWQALVSPEAIKAYMFGTTVVSEWRQGSPIVWKGEWKGQPYEDKGIIQQFEPGEALGYTHFSPLSGVPDAPENYHTATITLSGAGDGTRVELTQDKNASDEEREQAEQTWAGMLAGLKQYVEE
jgi:uncharacterized protein YndB with AHSA1/START domain